MVAIQVFLLVMLTCLITALALDTTTKPTHSRLVFPKVGDIVVKPTAQVQESRSPLSVQGIMPSPQSQPVRRYAVLEDTVPAAYSHHQDPSAHHQDAAAAAYHHWDGDEDHHHHHNHHPHDPPKYAYKYAVHDEHTGDSKQAWEHRDGDVTHGGYTVLDPDGHLRIVEYTVTKKGGFQAKVRREPHY